MSDLRADSLFDFRSDLAEYKTHFAHTFDLQKCNVSRPRGVQNVLGGLEVET